MPYLDLNAVQLRITLAARGIAVSHDVRQWARKFGQVFANQIRRRLPAVGESGTWMRSCRSSLG